MDEFIKNCIGITEKYGWTFTKYYSTDGWEGKGIHCLLFEGDGAPMINNEKKIIEEIELEGGGYQPEPTCSQAYGYLFVCIPWIA